MLSLRVGGGEFVLFWGSPPRIIFVPGTIYECTTASCVLRHWTTTIAVVPSQVIQKSNTSNFRYIVSYLVRVMPRYIRKSNISNFRYLISNVICLDISKHQTYRTFDISYIERVLPRYIKISNIPNFQYIVHRTCFASIYKNIDV